MKIKIFLIIAFTSLAIGLLLLAPSLANQGKNREISAQVAVKAAPASTEGYARATGPKEFSFPADYGPHKDFQTEWWYYTGNLSAEDGREFGYQLTFFRRALQPPGQVKTRNSDWGADQVYMAHFAITDVNGQTHNAVERLERGAAGLAGAAATPFKVWLGDWGVQELGPNLYRLYAVDGDMEIDLELSETKGPVLQGMAGYSQKGVDRGNASYYFSQPRLKSNGTIRMGRDKIGVSGDSWMDHEWSTSALSADQVGWDWFSIQLDDNSEIMAFQIRKDDGSIDPFSSGTIIDSAGNTRSLTRDDFIIEPTSKWKSPHTGADYPASWRLSIPSEQLVLEVKPLIADQELNVSYDYWEGAVEVAGEKKGVPVQGKGFVELTGYTRPMGGEF